MITFKFTASSKASFCGLCLVNSQRDCFLLFIRYLHILRRILRPFILLFPGSSLSHLICNVHRFFQISELRRVIRHARTSNLSYVTVMNNGRGRFREGFQGTTWRKRANIITWPSVRRGSIQFDFKRRNANFNSKTTGNQCPSLQAVIPSRTRRILPIPLLIVCSYYNCFNIRVLSCGKVSDQA